MNEYRSSASIAADHPCLDGHFPGNPIVPGVVLLELVAGAMREWQGPQAWIRKFNHTKFVGLLRADELVEILLQGDNTQIKFRCSCGERLLSQGTFEWARHG
ncbi:hydroxymyristoyl-ACP dehydratase [Stenotrophobium rhamnosiphilum]|uniref:Hydroxymyristoyl-ACP dehydratase n=1 Tax=Stenotrophobium rhamnosiphilum TaxID=2029166 RepID=A0A2T5MFN8_9GAMM|nr:hydroxymyristoyl-ACP dehydratase [Stenotrophobium rhamnosiphilum]PTU31391.1 hydroxymyristoyl-ACP dehydratase [Stenotrophobium rhamnosiphilum]